MTAVVYNAEQLAELTGVSAWTIYQSVKDGTSPFPFIRIGARRIVFPKAPADRLLGLSDAEESA